LSTHTHLSNPNSILFIYEQIYTTPQSACHLFGFPFKMMQIFNKLPKRFSIRDNPQDFVAFHSA